MKALTVYPLATILLSGGGLLAADSPFDTVPSAIYTAISVSDSRVVMEAVVTVESKDLVVKRSDSIYFIPIAVATEKEKKLNRGVVQDAWLKNPISESGTLEFWGYSLVIVAGKDEAVVNIEAHLSEKARVIERECLFGAPYSKRISKRISGFSFLIEWKKIQPNKSVETTETVARPPHLTYMKR